MLKIKAQSSQEIKINFLSTYRRNTTRPGLGKASLLLGQSASHQGQHRQIHHRFTRSGQAFVILAQASRRFSQPKVRSTIQRCGRSLKPLATSLRFTISKSSRRSAEPIPPRPPHTRHRPRSSASAENQLDFLQQETRPIPILDLCRVNHHLQDQAQSVHQDMPLDTIHLLARIVPTHPAALGGLHQLAVHDRRTRFRILAFTHAYFNPQFAVEPFPGSIATPVTEIRVTVSTAAGRAATFSTDSRCATNTTAH